MSTYTNVYIIPITERDLRAYIKLATKAGKIFVKHGALRYRE